MSRFARHSLVTVMIATLAFAGLGATGAGAVSARPNVSFVGVYAIHGTITGTTQHLKGTLTVNADGTATDGHGNIATWTSSGKTFTMVYSSASLTETFVANRTKKGLGSKAHPGTFTSTVAGLNGTWYGILQ
ncbi:MAG TPA: hypothetical protein VIK61_02790 [Acidimicrobiia bacterium]